MTLLKSWSGYKYICYADCTQKLTAKDAKDAKETIIGESGVFVQSHVLSRFVFLRARVEINSHFLSVEMPVQQGERGSPGGQGESPSGERRSPGG